MPRNMDMSKKVETKKPPLPKGRGTTEGGGGIQKRDLVHRKRIPQSALQTGQIVKQVQHHKKLQKEISNLSIYEVLD